MGNWQNEHPDPDELIRYSNGELSARESARVARHLENCWECRTEAEDTTSVIGRYIHYRRDLLHPSIPPPPKDWQDLSSDFARIRNEHRSPVAPSWPTWVMSLLRKPRLAATAAATLIVSAAALLYIPQSQSARAAELIEKAVRQERAMPVAVGADARIRVKSREGEFSRRGDLSEGAGEVVPAAFAATANRLEAQFQSARYNWLTPLSATSFSDWRKGLPDKHDTLSTSIDENARELVAVQTSTTGGTLGGVTLVLRKSDLHPIRCEFHFRDGDEVEISETTAPAQIASPRQPPRLAETARPSVQAKSESQPEVLLGSADELHVLAALHRIGADVNDSLNIRRENSRIVVSGIGIKAERQAEIAAAMGGLAHVNAEFLKPPPPGSVRLQLGEPLTERPGPLAFGKKIEDQVGGPAAMEAFSNSLLRLTETLLVRAHALWQLGDRFPADVERQFVPDDKMLLEQIRQDHAREVSRAEDQIQSFLSPVLEKLGVPVRVAQSSNPESWQLAAQNVLAAGQRFDRVLAATLAPTAGIKDESAELGSALGALQSAVAPLRVQRR
ncbi:MAG: hypothetical protein K2X03_02145 [Bryobacteraceae bacterium]|nr:hypothetical protein [Bryobacteraceae bacterium]